MREHRTELLDRVERLLSREYTVAEFRRRYYDFYLEVPEEALTDSEHMFFGFLQEMLDWTAEAPSSEDRQHGWVDHEEFIAWVAREREFWLRLGENYDQMSSCRN